MMMTALPIFTQDAQSNLERYLGRVKSALRPHPSVDSDDVEREIRGHIEAELEGASTPVTAERLRSVLDRLGSPCRGGGGCCSSSAPDGRTGGSRI